MCTIIRLKLAVVFLTLLIVVPLGVIQILLVNEPDSFKCSESQLVINKTLGRNWQIVNYFGVIIPIIISTIIIFLLLSRKIPFISVIISLVINNIIALLWLILLIRYYLNVGQSCITQLLFLGFPITLIILSFITYLVIRS